MSGFVYILENPSLLGIVKIGASEKHPRARADELFSSGVPTPFDVVYFCSIQKPFEVEATVHGALNEHRVHAQREFFRVASAQAAKAIEEACTLCGAEIEVRWTRGTESIAPLPPVMGGTCPSCGTKYSYVNTCTRCGTSLRSGPSSQPPGHATSAPHGDVTPAAWPFNAVKRP